MPEIEVAPVADEALASELARVINAAYAVGERGLWRADATRTSPEGMAERIRAGAMLVATANGDIVGCASVQPMDESTTELGLVSTLPGSWGGGVGGALVRAAEELARSRGSVAMQLKVLAPRNGAHAHKDRLSAWYRRLGYEQIDSLAFEDVSARSASELAVPCEFRVFRKPLTASM